MTKRFPNSKGHPLSSPKIKTREQKSSRNQKYSGVLGKIGSHFKINERFCCLTAVVVEGEVRPGWKSVKGSATKHTCTSHRQRQKGGEGQREGGRGLGGGGQRGVKINEWVSSSVRETLSGSLFQMWISGLTSTDPDFICLRWVS